MTRETTAAVGIQGGAHTIRQYLRTGVIDELRLHIVPAVPGPGERLFDSPMDLTLVPLAARHSELVTHIRYRVLKNGDVTLTQTTTRNGSRDEAPS